MAKKDKKQAKIPTSSDSTTEMLGPYGELSSEHELPDDWEEGRDAYRNRGQSPSSVPLLPDIAYGFFDSSSGWGGL